MAPHSSTLAWRIPWTEEPDGLPCVGLHRVRHDWSDLAPETAAIPLTSIYRSCHPTISSSAILFSSCLQSFPALGSFPAKSVLRLRWPKYWSFSLSNSPSNEYIGLISSRIDWFDLAVQGNFESLLQHHISKASILRCSAFFMVQLSHLYMTTGKTIVWLEGPLLAK